MAKLNEKQKLFCEHYHQSFNGADAARRAGYSNHTARQSASRLLSRLDIQTRLKRLSDRRQRQVGLSGDEVVQKVASMAFADVRDMVTEDGTMRRLQDLPADVASTLSSFTLTDDGVLSNVRTTDKIRSLELLAKHLGILTERHEHLHGHIITFSPDLIAQMSDAQLERLEVAQTTIVDLRREMGLDKSSSINGLAQAPNKR